MSPLFESFQKELGTRLAHGLSLLLVFLFTAAAFTIPADKQTVRLVLAALAVLSLAALVVGLLSRYRRGYIPDASWPGTMTKRGDSRSRICHHCYVTKHVALPLIWDPDNNRWGCSGCHTQLNKP
jgi:hypothetical protein